MQTLKRNYSVSPEKYQIWTQKDLYTLRELAKTENCFIIAKTLSRSYSSVALKMRRLKIPRIQTQRLQTKVNHDFFKNWSKAMAYVLGFWFADGYISKEPMYIFSIAQKNKKHLQKILNLMESDHNIYHSGKGVFVLSIGSKTIWNDIKQLGGSPAKSLTLKPPIIPKEYLNHFLRGFFDGDGWISIDKRGIRCGFCGTLEMMQFVNDNIPQKMIISQTKKQKDAKKNHWRLDCRGKICLKNLTYLYKDSCIRLDRKHRIFQLYHLNH